MKVGSPESHQRNTLQGPQEKVHREQLEMRVKGLSGQRYGTNGFKLVTAAH